MNPGEIYPERAREMRRKATCGTQSLSIIGCMKLLLHPEVVAHGYMDLDSTRMIETDSKRGRLQALALFKAVEEFLYPIYSEVMHLAL